MPPRYEYASRTVGKPTCWPEVLGCVRGRGSAVLLGSPFNDYPTLKDVSAYSPNDAFLLFNEHSLMQHSVCVCVQWSHDSNPYLHRLPCVGRFNQTFFLPVFSGREVYTQQVYSLCPTEYKWFWPRQRGQQMDAPGRPALLLFKKEEGKRGIIKKMRWPEKEGGILIFHTLAIPLFGLFRRETP